MASHVLLMIKKSKTQRNEIPCPGPWRQGQDLNSHPPGSNPCPFLYHNDIPQEKIHSLIKLLSGNEPGSAGKEVVVFFSLFV